MAYKRHNMTTPNPRTARVSGRVVIGAAGAVGSQTGTGYTVAKTATGKYTITFLDYYPTLISFTGDIKVTSADGDAVVNFGAFSASNNTLIVKTVLNGAVANLTSGDSFSFDLELACSTV